MRAGIFAAVLALSSFAAGACVMTVTVRRAVKSGKKTKRAKSARSSPSPASLTSWMIEFSKKVVILCVVIHAAAFVYAAAAMWALADISALSVMISESSEVLRSCVFAYMIKAGFENWQKIKKSSSDGRRDQNEV